MTDDINNKKDIDHLNDVYDRLVAESDDFEKDMDGVEGQIDSLLAELDEERLVLKPMLAELTREDEADFKALLEALAEAQ